MLLIDKLLLAPVHGLLWLAQEVDEMAQHQVGVQREAILRALVDLHARLEVGELTPQQFDAEEQHWLDRLDALERADAQPPDAAADGGDMTPDEGRGA
jgi:hypothetical protein